MLQMKYCHNILQKLTTKSLKSQVLSSNSIYPNIAPTTPSIYSCIYSYIFLFNSFISFKIHPTHSKISLNRILFFYYCLFTLYSYKFIFNLLVISINSSCILLSFPLNLHWNGGRIPFLSIINLI